MGVQLPTHLSPGGMAKAKRTKKTAAGRMRYLGPERISLGGEMSGYTIDRRAPKGHGSPVHALEDRTVKTSARYAGCAFSWWSGMTPAEREAAIARMVAENEPRHASGKAHGGKRPQRSNKTQTESP